MQTNSRVVGLVIARGGSKRIPNKNIRNFASQGPIIVIPIRNMMTSGSVDEVIVDTDSEQIATIAAEAGAATPYIRDPALAGDHATTLQVAKAAINRLALLDGDTLMLAYATSYLTPRHYSEALAAFTSDNPRMLISTSPSGVSHSRLLKIDAETGRLVFIYPENANSRSQDLQQTFRDAGKFYIASVKTWRDIDNIFSDATPFVLPPEYGIDLDTLEDWQLAETIYYGLSSRGMI